MDQSITVIRVYIITVHMNNGIEDDKPLYLENIII